MLGAARADRRAARQRVRRDEQPAGAVAARLGERRRLRLGRSVQQLSAPSAPSIARAWSRASSCRCSRRRRCDSAAATRAMLEARTRRMAIQCGEPGPFAQIIGGIDQALWDMSARRAGEPLWKHLGGAAAQGAGLRERPRARRRRRDGARQAARKASARSSSRSASRASATARMSRSCATRSAPTPRIMVRRQPGVDARSRRAAEIDELAPFKLHWIEEPIAADESVQAWQQLAARTGAPLAAGENLRGLAAFAEAIDAGYLRFIQPDVGKWGGISGCREVARHAARKGIAFCPHWLAGGVGLAASMHLLAALGGDGYAEVDANPNPLREEVFPLRVDEGVATLSDVPGHRRRARSRAPEALPRPPMKIATWNVNSLRVRLPHLLDWLAAAQPDVACLQETKTEDANFPARRDSGRGLPGGVLRTEVLQRRGDPRALGADRCAARHPGLSRRSEARHRRDGRRRAHPQSVRTERAGAGLGQVRLQAAVVRRPDPVVEGRSGQKAGGAWRSQHRARSPATCTTRSAGKARSISPSPSAPRSAKC